MVSKLLSLFLLISASTIAFALPDKEHAIIISVPDQKMVVLENKTRVAQYPVSTSRFGLGDTFHSYATPTGWMEVAQKIGNGLPAGAVFKNRRPTGEVLAPNAAGRDPIVTRILWLRGLETSSRNAFTRNIYIHGTPVEKLIGTPASYGCIRMRSKDIIDLFNRVGVGAKVDITTERARRAIKLMAMGTSNPPLEERPAVTAKVRHAAKLVAMAMP